MHAFSHALGGYYNVPHGLANAILLPRVLESFGPKAYARLSEIADTLALSKGKNKEEKAKAVIAWVDEMNEKLGIPKGFKDVIKEEDIMPLSEHAAKEGNPLYPVPKEFDAKELSLILRRVIL